MKSTNRSAKVIAANPFFKALIYLPKVAFLQLRLLKERFKLFVLRREQRILLLRLGYPLPEDGNYYWPGEEVKNPSDNTHAEDSIPFGDKKP